MEKIDYTKVKAQPDLATVISVIFLFGPPRVAEAFLTTEFTSRVHMKEKEIKIFIETLNPTTNQLNEVSSTEPDVNFNDCEFGKFSDSRCFRIMQYIFTFLFGCFKSSVDQNEDKCECCTLLHLKSTENIPKNSGETDLKKLEFQSESEDKDTGKTSQLQAMETKTEITIVRIPSLWLTYKRGLNQSAPDEHEVENVNTEDSETRL